jgi:hypothetical protein
MTGFSHCLEMNLFPEGFLDLADFLANLTGYLFANAFAFQIWIVRQFAHFFLYRALHFVNFACDFILSTWLHVVASLTKQGLPHREPDKLSATILGKMRADICTHRDTFGGCGVFRGAASPALQKGGAGERMEDGTQSKPNAQHNPLGL